MSVCVCVCEGGRERGREGGREGGRKVVANDIIIAISHRLEEVEGHVGVLEERGRVRREEIRGLREQLRAEQAERCREKEAHTQVCHYSRTTLIPLAKSRCSDFACTCIYTHVHVGI